MKAPCLHVLHLGVQDFRPVMQVQNFLHGLLTSPTPLAHAGLSETPLVASVCERLAIENISQSDSFILSCTHSPGVYTMGRRDCINDLQLSPAERSRSHTLPGVLATKNGIDVLKTNRGGGITFHGPGQGVVYFVTNALRLHAERGEKYASWSSPLRFFVWLLEESTLTALREIGVSNARRDGAFPGIWTPNGKIGFVGIQFSKWVSRHGISLNVTKEGELPMRDIVMCEKPGDRPTSIEREMRTKFNKSSQLRHCIDSLIQSFTLISGLNKHNNTNVLDWTDSQ